MNTQTFQALADPHRFQMVELLRQAPLTVGELAARLDLKQPQASKHLRVLSDAGLVELRPQANRRICHLRPEPFEALDDWLTTFRQLWQGRFDRLDDYLQQLQPPAPDAPSDDQGETP
ncbi:metalloregulator ArsR/SmtB family transcription factor [Deinococcus sp. HMF7620]|uniref:Metalloregulator ArsR/SmtB family transcription factor n=1 Tax=Deinococcus arboris TaxID=2682977 RepID=A0A7C9HVW5_9DEIO|nr:metalloregulator ArsR/SmtB family transcription factor [Deinococcus betulae]MVN85570.1 metalloregulator ArsR/SmtB family transcription factor [Deinococcus arboris]